MDKKFEELVNKLAKGEKLTWQDAVPVFCAYAHSKGEWAGAPIPIRNHKLILEPRHPFYSVLNGSLLKEDDDVQFSWDSDSVQETITDHVINACLKNRFFSHSKNCEISIWQNPVTKKIYHTKKHQGTASRVSHLMSCMEAATSIWRLDAELRATKKLKYHLTEREHMWTTYMLTGMFLESSKRSGIFYLFRKMRPTLALGVCKKTESMKVLASLCMHPIGYYNGTHAGVMVPTDDIIAHLLMMRGDERRFWSKCNQHPIWSEFAGD